MNSWSCKLTQSSPTAWNCGCWKAKLLHYLTNYALYCWWSALLLLLLCGRINQLRRRRRRRRWIRTTANEDGLWSDSNYLANVRILFHCSHVQLLPCCCWLVHKLRTERYVNGWRWWRFNRSHNIVWMSLCLTGWQPASDDGYRFGSDSIQHFPALMLPGGMIQTIFQ